VSDERLLKAPAPFDVTACNVDTHTGRLSADTKWCQAESMSKSWHWAGRSCVGFWRTGGLQLLDILSW